ncbi:MAG: tRNA adenosine(34) deaminase TadA [Bacteroidota bacterium]
MQNPWEIHQRYMRQAIELAKEAWMQGEVPVGALVVNQGRIVGRGTNRTESLGDPTAHAEMIAISAACSTLQSKYLTDCTLYVTLEPCPMCSGAMVWSKLDRLVFGAVDEKAGACGSRFQLASNWNLNHQIEIIQGIEEDECSDLLKRFFREQRVRQSKEGGRSVE